MTLHTNPDGTTVNIGWDQTCPNCGKTFKTLVDPAKVPVQHCSAQCQKPIGLSLKIVQERCKELGITVRRRAFYNEYRVNYVNGTEETAYYTDDIFDAMATAVAMAAVRRTC